MTSAWAEAKICVTGGCGFIGSHLVERLRKLGASIVVIDKSLPFMPLEDLVSGPPIQFHRFELGVDKRENLRELLRGIDIVFHLAAQKHQQLNQEWGPNLNVIGTEHLLRAAKVADVKKIVFTSSLYAYGRMSGPPMVETELPQPITEYGISKLQCEHACHRMSVLSRIPIVVLRLFFTYGLRYSAAYPSVITKNFARILAGERPVIHGDGMQVLDYSYVDDVVDKLLAASAYEKFGVFNVGSGIPMTITTLLCYMADIAGVPYDFDAVPADWTAGSYRVADTVKFTKQFGILSSVGPYTGLQRMFDWMKANA